MDELFPSEEPIFIPVKQERKLTFAERDITFNALGLAVSYAGCGTHALEVTMQLDLDDAQRLIERIQEAMENSG